MDKLLFLNVASMPKYQGMLGEKISGGAKFVRQHGYGSEIFNFKPYKGRMYGFGRPPGPRHGAIKLEKLGAHSRAEKVNGVTVVWVANSRIVGWYKNATVYRHGQPPPRKSGRTHKGRAIIYNVTAKKSDHKRIDPPEARVLLVPRARERNHAMGRYLWYAEGPSNAAFRQKVQRYIAADGDISVIGEDGKKNKKPTTPGSPRQQDINKKQRIERIAMDLTSRHFGSLKYNIVPIYKDNLGWDLDAVHRYTGVRLKLEVKGLSGGEVRVEMTPQST
ncbi:MAG: hypothetical protein WA188_22480 [Terriglobales bacterium]